MAKGQSLGLDELMIVNPGPPGLQGQFLGADGTLYQVQGSGEGHGLQGLGQFFLGADGTLYQVQGIDAAGAAGLAESPGEGSGDGSAPGLGRYFLGADGALYEIVR